MTPIQDRLTPEDLSETEREVVGRMMTDRARLAEERRLRREERRHRERQFAVVVLTCAAVSFVIGIAIAMLIWRPEAPPGSQSDAAGLTTYAMPEGRASAVAVDSLRPVERRSARLTRLSGVGEWAPSALATSFPVSSLARGTAGSALVEALEHG